MAQRRRRRFNRVNPDMGWWVDSGNATFIYDSDPAAVGSAVSILQFDDITDDDSLITRDNSDWFVKRVLLEVYPVLGGAESPARCWTLAIGSIDNDKLAEWVVNQSDDLFSPNGYEMWARIYRQFNRPVYRTAQVRVNDLGLGQLVTSTTVNNAVNMVAGEPWGPAHIEADFPISNAGLRPEQSVSLAFGALEGPFGYQWEDGDNLAIRWNTRILLQKRRAA